MRIVQGQVALHLDPGAKARVVHGVKEDVDQPGKGGNSGFKQITNVFSLTELLANARLGC